MTTQDLTPSEDLTRSRLAKTLEILKASNDLTRSEWRVKRAADAFAVQCATGTSAVFFDQERACLAAAILPQTDRELPYRLIRRDKTGFDVTLESARTVGWIREYSPETIEALHVTERIVRSPEALAWLLEAVSPEALEAAWRIVGLRRDPSVKNLRKEDVSC